MDGTERYHYENGYRDEMNNRSSLVDSIIRAFDSDQNREAYDRGRDAASLDKLRSENNVNSD